MAEPPSTYQRLPGFSRRYFESCRLYQAPDHLLLVSSNGFNENYKRFYFRDIQAFIIRQTRERLFWNLIGAVPLTVCGFILLMLLEQGFQRGFQNTNIPGLAIGGFMTALVLVCVIVNTARGATCVCEIQTAVQTRALPSLNRVPCARKVIARLRPIIETEQGRLTNDELAERLDGSK
jgi:hypothetical protein